jgi:integrase
VASLRRWLALSGIERGFVFRGVDMVTGRLMDAPLAPVGVSRRLQRYVGLLGLDPSEFGGHSLRSGFVTSAYRLGRKVPDIMEATGHHSLQEVHGYIRRAGLVEESAGRGLVDEARRKAGLADEEG